MLLEARVKVGQCYVRCYTVGAEQDITILVNHDLETFLGLIDTEAGNNLKKPLIKQQVSLEINDGQFVAMIHTERARQSRYEFVNKNLFIDGLAALGQFTAHKHGEGEWTFKYDTESKDIAGTLISGAMGQICARIPAGISDGDLESFIERFAKSIKV